MQATPILTGCKLSLLSISTPFFSPNTIRIYNEGRGEGAGERKEGGREEERGKEGEQLLR
jgi:hypothetical protein